MKNVNEYGQLREDEIGLIDLAAIFVRRRRVFYVVFIIVVFAGLAYALFSSDKYEYVSLIQLAEHGDGEPVEQPAAVIATIKYSWLPEVSARFRAEHEKKLPFEVSAINPEETSLIRLETDAEQKASDLVSNIYTALIKSIKKHQNNLLDAEKKNLQRQIESLDKIIDTLKGQQGAGQALATAIDKRVGLESELEQLRPAYVLVVSRESAHKTGPKRMLIVALAVLLGLMMGVFAVFLFEFVGLVKQQVMRDASN